MSSDMTAAEQAELSRMYDKMQPPEDSSGRYGQTAMEQLRAEQFKARQRASIHAAQVRLAKSKKIRDNNRKKNKASRKARSKQRG